jgi:uncharacterized protein YndB with AHSA1/START domain
MPSRVLVALRVRATPARAFDTFTREIGDWWKPNGLFQFTGSGTGQLYFESREGGRLLEMTTGGGEFEIGRISVWEPPRRLVFSWRQETFAPDQETQVHVTFDPAGDETRVTVEHFGWDSIPQEHAARHGFPLDVFQQRHAEWWQTLLASLRDHVSDSYKV